MVRVHPIAPTSPVMLQPTIKFDGSVRKTAAALVSLLLRSIGRSPVFGAGLLSVRVGQGHYGRLTQLVEFTTFNRDVEGSRPSPFTFFYPMTILWIRLL